MVFGMAKAVVRSTTPSLYAWLRRRCNPNLKLLAKIGKRCEYKVSAGPFTGLKFVPDTTTADDVSKLVGSYEAELHQVLAETLSNVKFERIINLGCAHGYYAVGLAKACPGVKIVAIDINPEMLKSCKALAEANGVLPQIDLVSSCDAEKLGKLARGRTLIVSDCEGFEVTAFPSSEVHNYCSSYFLIELHDCFVPGITPTLIERFSATHEIRIIDATPRDPADYPVLAGLTEAEKSRALDEGREIDGKPIKQQWAFMKPKV